MALRLFVAFELPEALREAVGRRMVTVRQEHSDLLKARWVRADALHLTLKFLGPTAETKLPDLISGLAEAFAASAAVWARLSGAGTYPPVGRGRVAWLGLEVEGGVVGLRLLSSLVREVERVALEEAGVAPEGRPFSPHVTLARCDPPWDREAVRSFVGAFAGLPSEPFPLAEGVLMESALAPGGSRYRTLARFPMAEVERAAGDGE